MCYLKCNKSRLLMTNERKYMDDIKPSFFMENYFNYQVYFQMIQIS